MPTIAARTLPFAFAAVMSGCAIAPTQKVTLSALWETRCATTRGWQVCVDVPSPQPGDRPGQAFAGGAGDRDRRAVAGLERPRGLGRAGGDRNGGAGASVRRRCAGAMALGRRMGRAGETRRCRGRRVASFRGARVRRRRAHRCARPPVGARTAGVDRNGADDPRPGDRVHHAGRRRARAPDAVFPLQPAAPSLRASGAHGRFDALGARVLTGPPSRHEPRFGAPFQHRGGVSCGRQGGRDERDALRRGGHRGVIG